jgi:hypothetical protein
MVTNVKIIHGANDDVFTLPIGTTILGIRRNLSAAFNIPDSASAFVNGIARKLVYFPRPGDVLEFVVEDGRKGGDDPSQRRAGVDITRGVGRGMVHIDLPRLGPTCKRIGIQCWKAIVDWNEFGRGRNKQSHPVYSGVVIQQADHVQLLEAIAEKEDKKRRLVGRLSILAAIFTLNRRAKRCRDLAQTYYQNSMHGFAGKLRKEKEQIYDLKGQVLHHLVEAGRFVGGAFHRFEGGNWTEVLEGEGYRFHRPCPPQPGLDSVEIIESVEAKPKEAKEPTLEIAYMVVENFLQGKSRAAVYQWPLKVRRFQHHRRHDYDEYGDGRRDGDDDHFDQEEEN